MGLYSNLIFPKACDMVMSAEEIGELRDEFLAEVSGNVLEIGFGTGLNLHHYPDRIRKLTVVEPNTGMSRRASPRIQESGIDVETLTLSSESLPLADETYDSVVSSWTLCSIPSVDRALGEIYRVLKPGGHFFFVEHGLSPDRSVSRWQGLLNPLQRFFGDGCNLNRPIDQLVSESGLEIENLRRFYLDGSPRIYGYTYLGQATKRAGGRTENAE